ERIGIEAGAYVLKAAYAGQSGKLAYARVFGKPLADGSDLILPDGERCRAGRPLFAVALSATNRKDDVRLSGALSKLIEEDPGLSLTHDPEAHQMLLA